MILLASPCRLYLTMVTCFSSHCSQTKGVSPSLVCPGVSSILVTSNGGTSRFAGQAAVFKGYGIAECCQPACGGRCVAGDMKVRPCAMPEVSNVQSCRLWPLRPSCVRFLIYSSCRAESVTAIDPSIALVVCISGHRCGNGLFSAQSIGKYFLLKISAADRLAVFNT
ncbi:hypothetical protein EDD36DRAFT_64284 [Exophiala viscosa]|uniref:Uncharacterized protein n=1 Tax=Exophiala viscosa TaxID=2486360 RepID=A0AAN6IAF2_9EURO|nr:hypothetical protein EDD36DRAFT_64284 [Exophiala viscosa]